MTEDADTGLFIFDGENNDVFTDILSMVIQDKTSVVIMCKTGESHVVKSIEDLKALIGWRSKSHVYMDGYVPKEKYDPAIRACVPSKEMADHLIQNPVPKKQLIEIIVNAPVDIYIIKKLYRSCKRSKIRKSCLPDKKRSRTDRNDRYEGTG